MADAPEDYQPRHLAPAKRSTFDRRELGRPGTRLWAGYLSEESNPDLRGTKGLDTYRLMSNDPTVAAGLKVIELPIRSTEHFVEPASQDPDDVYLADLVHHCLPGDQVVLDASGNPRPIAGVRTGDMVLTQKGRARVVTHTWVRPYAGPMVSVRVMGYPHPIRLTPEHKVPTEDGWKTAGELVVGDRLFRPRPFMAEGGDYDSAWLVGLYLAEGSRDQRGRATVTYTVHRDEAPAVVALIARWARRRKLTRPRYGRTLSWEPHVSYVRTAKSAHVSFCHPVFRALIDEWVYGEPGRGVGSRTKRLTKMPVQEEFARGLWDGWQYGDGSEWNIKTNGKPYRQAAAVTVSPALAQQMQLIGGALGFPASLRLLRHAGGRTIAGVRTMCSDAYSVNAMPVALSERKQTPELAAAAKAMHGDGVSTYRIGVELGVSQMAAWHWVNDPPSPATAAKGNQCRVEPDAIIHRITGIESEPFVGDVYDLTVEEDHTFCAGPIAVSNSLFSFGTQSYDDVLRMATVEPLRYGFQPLEVVWDRETQGRFAGRVLWDKLAYRDPRTRLRWNVEEVDTPGGGRMRRLVSMTQQAPPTYELIDIPATKLLLFVNEQLGENYDGVALLRKMYQPWFIKQQLIRIQAIGLERTYMGLPIATLPEDFTKEEEAAARTIVENITVRENAGAVHSEAMQLSVMSNKLEGAAMAEAIGFHDGQILEPMLSQFLKLGHSGVGAYSLSEDHSELFLQALNALDNHNEAVINMGSGIPTLIDLNFADVDRSRYPRMTHGRIGRRDLDKLGRLVAALGQWGFITPDQATEDRWREMLELPDREESITPEAYQDLLDTVGGAQREKLRGAKRADPESVAPADIAVTPVPGTQTQAAAGQALNAAEPARWLRGSIREHRARFKAMDFAEEVMGDLAADARRMSQATPDPPSLRLLKARRPYRLMEMAEPLSQVKATIKRVNAEALAGKLKILPEAKQPTSSVVPRQRVIAKKHEAGLRRFMEAKGKAAKEKVA